MVSVSSRTDYLLGGRLISSPPGGSPSETLAAAREGAWAAAIARAKRCASRPSRPRRGGGASSPRARARGRARLPRRLEVHTHRPRRSSAAELEDWAARLDEWGDAQTATFVREAAAAYAERGLLA